IREQQARNAKPSESTRQSEAVSRSLLLASSQRPASLAPTNISPVGAVAPLVISQPAHSLPGAPTSRRDLEVCVRLRTVSFQTHSTLALLCRVVRVQEPAYNRAIPWHGIHHRMDI
ncbi:hypothetical protein SPRG_19481, partial [Saprolegnia parasitica CBS 223.65]